MRTSIRTLRRTANILFPYGLRCSCALLAHRPFQVSSSCLALGLNRLGLVLVVASGPRRNFPDVCVQDQKEDRTPLRHVCVSFTCVCVAVEPVHLPCGACRMNV